MSNITVFLCIYYSKWYNKDERIGGNMKKMIIAWIFIATILFCSLLTIGIFNTKKYEEYKTLENDLVEAAKGYIELTDKKITNKTVKITEEDLDEKKILPNMEVDDDLCSGYVKVNNTINGLNYKAVIKCDKYETIE